jgi:hypothetical protein
MNVSPRLTALAAVLGLGIAGLAATSVQAAPAARPHIRVVGIARDGKQVPVFATIYSRTDLPILTKPGRTYVAPAGPLWIGADVQTRASQTLVLRRLVVRHSMTVRLDARPGVRVRFSLNVPGATEQFDSVQACVGGQFVVGAGVGAGGFAGPLYVVPVRDRNMLFGFGSQWQSTTAGYNTAGQSRGGIPARPDYPASLSGMAKITLTYRSGEAPGYNNPALTSNKTCGSGFGLGLNPANGHTQTEYVTAGSWTTELSGKDGFWQDSRRYAALRSYSNTFGGAVWGPGTEAPRSGGNQITFFPDSPFADPGQSLSIECCDKSSITLSMGGHVLKHKTLNEYRQERDFSAHATAAGWYTLAIRAWRWAPHQTMPKDELSSHETYLWRFHAAPSSIPAGYQREVPAYVARIWAGGLSIDNRAAAGGTTSLTIHILRTHDNGIQRAPRYRLTSVRAQVSFDGGKTWQALSLDNLGGAWQATVHDPEKGFVALRTTITDSRGDTSEQTIYRAYAIG